MGGDLGPQDLEQDENEMTETEEQETQAGQSDALRGFDVGIEEVKKQKREPPSFAELNERLAYALVCHENERFRRQIKDQGHSAGVWPSNRDRDDEWKRNVGDCVVYLEKRKVPLLDDNGEPKLHQDGNQKMTYVFDSWFETSVNVAGGVKPFVLTMKDGKLSQVAFKGVPQLGLYPKGEYEINVIDYASTKAHAKPLLCLLAETYLDGVRALRNVFLMYNYKKQDKPSGNGSASEN